MSELFTITFIAFLILIIAHFKKDHTSYIFGAILLVYNGLKIVNTYDQNVGLIIIFYGVYVGFRASIELFTTNVDRLMERGFVWQKKNQKK